MQSFKDDEQLPFLPFGGGSRALGFSFNLLYLAWD
jgi:hypothetical protein